MRRIAIAVAVAVAAGASARIAHGQAAPAEPAPAKPPAQAPPAPPAEPSPAAAPPPEIALDVDREIDIASVVTSAAKGVTTVQEAPSIVTIVTADEIRQRGFREIGQVLETLPGWLTVTGEGNQVSLPMVRGNVQATLYLRDGVSLFDPVLNVATLSRALPLELVKRVEVVTGPGGVLWGANSFLGVVNVITKDPSDIGGHGFEVSAGYGDGRGGRQDFKAYALFGRSLWKDRFKVVAHASFESFLGPEYSNVPYLATSASPQPAGPGLYGQSAISSGAARSWLLNLDAKMTLGPVSLYGSFPLGDLNHSLGFGNGIVAADPNRNRDAWNFYDRFGILEYKDRFFKDKLGLNAKGYFVQFNRSLEVRLYPDSGFLANGFTFRVPDLAAYRYGGTLDADLTGPWSWNRIVAGAEVFHEQVPESHLDIPYPDAQFVPLVCPLQADGVTRVAGCPLTFIRAAERTVVGAFIADQIRPIPQLTFDGGVRYQQGFGQRGYAPQVLGSAAAVAQFLPDAHLKLNFSQGFRAPVFNSTDGNGAGVEFGGNPDLKVERSESYQGEVNARVLKEVKKIRELQLRADYSYTVLNDFIVIRNGAYSNSGKRGIHSVEALARLYLQGDHFLTASYTYLRVSTTDLGQLRNVPNHWFSLGAVFNLVKDVLDVNLNLNVLGAYEDLNRYRSQTYTAPLDGTTAVGARYTDLTFDQLSPVALLQLGVRLRILQERLAFSVQFHNVLNQHYYYPDVFYDQAPTIEMRPTPAPGFSFFAALTYRP